MRSSGQRVASTSAFARLRHAAGSWRAYARLARKDAYKVIQRLRSLEARARATTSDVFLRSAFRLPDEMLLKVLGFWRATTSTGVPL